jgi:thioredoxin 1
MPMMRWLETSSLLVLLATAALVGCDAPPRETPLGRRPGVTGTAATPPSTAPRRLVFFMNPNGQPCQLQDRILRSLAGDLAGKAEVVYYRTTSAADLAQFDAFGIRGLPTLVVTDASGNELRRATPGIQGPEQVLALVRD